MVTTMNFLKLLPFLKEVVDKGDKIKEYAVKGGGKVVEYTRYIQEKGTTVWVRVFESADGSKVLSDAAIKK